MSGRPTLLAVLIAMVLPASAHAAPPTATITWPQEGGVVTPSDDIAGPIFIHSSTVNFDVTDEGAKRECRIDDAAFVACDSDPDSHNLRCLQSGPHTFQLRLTDEAGEASITTRHWTQMGWAPNPQCPVVPPAPEPDLSDSASPFVSFTGGIAAGAWSRDRDVTISFSASGAECAVDDGAFASCDGSYTASGLADGTHSVSVRAGGQTAVRRFRVDATAPDVFIGARPREGEVISAGDPVYPSYPTAYGNALLPFSPMEKNLATTECRFDGDAFGACTKPYAHSFACLPNGAHTFELRLTDKAGNVTRATRTFALHGLDRDPSCPAVPEPDLSDTPASTVTFTGGIAAGAWSRERDVTVAFSAAGAECAADDGTFAPCDGSFTARGLTDGVHSVSVRSGGQTAVRRFRVDAAAPTAILGWADGYVLEPSSGITSPIWMGSSFPFRAVDVALASRECRFDDGPFGACDTPTSHAVYCLPNAPHTFELRLTDKAGNVTVATSHFELKRWARNPFCQGLPPEDLSDTPASTVTFTGGIAPGAWTDGRFVLLQFTATGPAQCAIDDEPFTACLGSLIGHDLGDATHRMSIRSGGETAVRRFRVDAHAPQVSFGPFPAEADVIAGNRTYTKVTFTATDPYLASVQCRFDDAAFAACTGQPHSADFHCLANGTHTLQVKAADAAGNVTTAARKFTMTGWTPAADCGTDVRPPDVPAIQPSPRPTPGTTPAAPTPRLAFEARNTRKWTRLRAIKLIDAPAGAKVSVSCKGCAKKVRKLSDLNGRKLKPGTRVFIRVGARTITIKIRANRAPLVV